MPHLLHFSEDPDIKVFKPHVPASSPDIAPMVWAVDAAHAPGFWFPRMAPRACCWRGEKPLTDLGRELLGNSMRMHAMERAWLEPMRSCRMYVYRFDSTPFSTQNTDAGYYSTRETIKPLSVATVGDLLELHAQAGIELRIVENLWPTIDAILESGLEFSIIRKMNALPRGAM